MDEGQSIALELFLQSHLSVFDSSWPNRVMGLQFKLSCLGIEAILLLCCVEC